MSHYSTASGAPRTNTMQQNVSQQMSTTSCLNACHSAYTSSQSHPLESGTSLVVNTWLTAQNGATVDAELAQRLMQHAKRRGEDQAVILSSLHQSCPALLEAFLQQIPLSVPAALYTALNALRPFLRTVTSTLR